MKKILLSLLLAFLCVFTMACGDGGMTSVTEATKEKDTVKETESATEKTTDGATESDLDESSETVESTETVKETETEEETTVEIEDSKAMENVDFIVSVPKDKTPVILQLTDTQIIDSSQSRTSDRLGSTHQKYWGPDKKEDRAYGYLREIITETKPDLIILTGDLIYGEFDDSGRNFMEFVNFMDSFDIPWAPIFGNHDNESTVGVDWQCRQFEEAENCLFKQRRVSGNGNYTVGIEQGGKLTRVFFMLDSNGCGGASSETLSNGHTVQTQGFGSNQITWYKKTAKAITDASPDTKLSFAFHIQLDVFGEAFAKYTNGTTDPVFIDYADNKSEGDFGYFYKHYSGWDNDRQVWEGIKELGVDSIFIGHEHANSASVVYEGVRIQYGMKSTAYDSINYIDSAGNIEFSAYSTNTPWVGGSVFSLDGDGVIIDPYIYYCKNAGGEIDWDSIYKKNEESEIENVFDAVDFTVNVPEGREPVVLHITDMQIIDSSQERSSDRLGSTAYEYWGKDKKNDRCYNYLREIITETDPDLIIITGDLVYGEFDDNGESLIELIEFMESFDIPWAPVFGNHDNESKKGVDWQCEQLENAENCLFLQRTLTGNGNYTVGIKQGDKLTRVFFMMDSNGCGGASEESLANRHTKTSVGFGKDQMDWYTSLAKNITRLSPDTKLSMAFHIQLSVFGDAFAKYGTDGKTQAHIDQLENKNEGDFGFIGAAMKGPWDSDKSVFNGLKELGFDSILVGHEHANSASIVYEGIRLQYGMKCSAYDRLNYISSDGRIESTYYSTNTPWIGGTVMKLDPNGTIYDAYIYYCKDAGGSIDWDSFKPKKEAAVNGLNKENGITHDSAITVTGINFDSNITAYEVVALSQGKVFINTDLIKNKSTFTFTVYVPDTSTAKLGGYGEFAIRVKPNDKEPIGDGTVDGYINYNSSSTLETYKLKYDTWQTFTVDISDLGDECTEFAFVIAKGNTIYLRDIVIE